MDKQFPNNRKRPRNPVRSTGVRGTILAAAAASALALAAAMAVSTGCSNDSSSTTTANCVDASGNVLPDSDCQQQQGSGGYAGGGSGAHWVYGGTVSGSRITGGSETEPDDGEVRTTSGTVLRGGFGGEGGEGDGGDGDGGHGGSGGE